MRQFYTFSSINFLWARKIIYCIFFVHLTIASPCQTNISGVVNTYHKVIEVISAKACLRVADTTGLRVNNMVMIAQMKGATISTASNSTFGDISSLNGAGNYEIATICYIIEDSVFLFHNLLNSYDVSSKVQLVQFAEYLSANVVDTVKAASWDSVGGTGGVIAIYTDLSLTLNAPIYADSSGYAGGIYNGYIGNCPVGTGFVYDASNTGSLEGAYKGEGVANISSAQDGGKGAPANGGGGGNNHNNSGGGGANLVAGGNGGGSGSTGPISCLASGNYGRAGKLLNSSGGLKIFMGGGGGAGHANNGSTSFNYGGNGGGIIFIWCNTLIGNNKPISANGGTGGASQSDGAGGGGAGGTIIMHVTNYTGNVFINANGGNGGQSDDGGVSGRCFGGGGGGSGGAVYFTGATPSVTNTANGGSGGTEINGLSCGTLVPGAAGGNGPITPNYSFSRSLSTAGYCLLLLPSKLLYFNAQLNGRTVILNWQIDHPELVEKFIVEKRTDDNNGWTELTSIDADDRFKYAATDPVPSWGNNFYRLKIIEKDGTIFYSTVQNIRVNFFSPDMLVYPNPAINKVFVSGKLQIGSDLTITDMSGKIVWQQKVTGNYLAIQLPLLFPGVYIIRHNSTCKKLVIQQ